MHRTSESVNEQVKGKKFLVVGGAGFIGSHIVERLAGLGANVIALDDLSNGKLANLPKADTVNSI
ncbi:MAG: NAD-dependent epimerase/dehydratase family protein, partial [Nitrososphaerota archaeon]|nr:NAD-dependent epimerase/dehydratase family protein [Nitrososphaerota archaeon]